jgi:hypothetical protein
MDKYQFTGNRITIKDYYFTRVIYIFINILQSLISKTMKKASYPTPLIFSVSVILLFLCSPCLRGQETGKPSMMLPDSVNKIVSVSCVPCHTDKGGLMPKSRLNFSSWTQYSAAKQKEKADLMDSVLEKDKMPPKEAREKRPEIIPTKEQKEIIKRWAESLKTIK